MKLTKTNKKRILKYFTGILMVLIIYILNDYGIIKIEKVEEEQALAVKKEGYIVTRVVDGDTIIVTKDGTETKVRLIGIDTPESVHPDKEKNTEFGELTSEYTKNKLLNKQVVLELDVQEKDKYGRVLAYVYIDGVMFNKLLLQEGMAQVSTYPPNVKYVEEFEEIQKKARTDKVGLWADGFINN